MAAKFLQQAQLWWDTTLNFFYPPVCQICRENRVENEEGFVCSTCWTGKNGVRYVVPPFCERCGLPFEGDITTQFECSNCSEMELHFTSARSAVITTPLLMDVIHRYKYKREIWFEKFLGQLLVSQAAPVLQEKRWDFIVPVPLHRKKRREREFNQAERLAKYLSKATKVPVNKKLLQRVEFTRTQTQLTRSERTDNVRRAFAMAEVKKLNGEKIILLDDVLTTGATTSACARILRESGAGEVCVWTVARADFK